MYILKDKMKTVSQEVKEIMKSKMGGSDKIYKGTPLIKRKQGLKRTYHQMINCQRKRKRQKKLLH